MEPFKIFILAPDNTHCWLPGGGVGVTLYYNYAPCAFSLKIKDPLLRTACTESHPPIAETDTKYTHPYCRARALLQTYKNV
jgi:hypothetical protein